MLCSSTPMKAYYCFIVLSNYIDQTKFTKKSDWWVSHFYVILKTCGVTQSAPFEFYSYRNDSYFFKNVDYANWQ